MSVTSHVFPKFQEKAFSKILALNTDALKVALYNGSTPVYSSLYSVVTKTDYETALSVSEITATGYTAGGLALTSVTITTTGTVTKLTCANPSWATFAGTASQALFYDTTASSDVICYADFGGAQSITAGPFTLAISASGLVTATAS